ncbi:MAG: hypothetical protein D3909_03255, partial [Candidatus Electrothrix sp. ATG1]|nr:hypothetical protein [Candidatus Electrothrix sp. ATG1]
MLYNLYQILGAVLYPLLVIVSPLFARCLPHWQVTRRFGRYPGVHQVTQRTAASGRKQLIWIHAASVGEVQAAQALLAVLMDTLSEV